MSNYIIENLVSAVTETEAELQRLSGVIEELRGELAAARTTPSGELIMINKEVNTCCFFGKQTTHEEALEYVVDTLGWQKTARTVYAVRLEQKYEPKTTFERRGK